MNDNLPEARPGLVQRLWRSVQRDPLSPESDRDRMRLVMNNLILHLHPSKVAARTLRFNYTFGLGGLLALLAVIQVVTGVLLMFAYTPSPDSAYQSMLALQTEVPFGQLIRNLHHWSANLMIVAIVLHLLRVFFTGGFASPRQFNWVLGIILLLLVVGANFTGYLLPWDQLAYWAVTVGSSLIGYIPLAGDAITRLLLGGPEVGAATLTNFYGLHVAVIPLTLFAVMSFHLWRVRKDTLTVPRRADEPGDVPVEKVTTIPHLVSRELIFALVMLALIIAWAVVFNAPLEEAANPDHSPNPAKAAWYFMGLQELLLHFHPTFGAIIIPGLALLGLAALPYLEPDMEAQGIWFRSIQGRWIAGISIVIGVLSAALFVGLDEVLLDLPALLPFLPTVISNGWVPLAGILLFLLAYYEGLYRLGATACEARLAIFTLLLAAFFTFTIIGIFFRGEGMALVMPWSVIP
ncbi:MAG: cytochrome b N-terminal domain-containing protein [Anaerolineae bacterium]|nr:cytochrome b N-terminal domain-containing protein [Anaerolineae bacterium]